MAPHLARRGRRASIMLTLAVLALLAVPAVASAWSNGGHYGNGFGTHDWVLFEANRLAAARGYHWLVWSSAQPVTDDPDTKLGDTWYHCYDVWGARYGGAPDKVAGLYAATVRAIGRGDRFTASRRFGRLAHYFADICNPTHTDSTNAEERMHASYEQMVEGRTDAKGENRAWVSFDGIDARGSARSATVSAARFSHQYYRSLVGTYNAHGYNGTVSAITRRCLNRAVNDLADLIASAQKAAG